ncbi:MAG: TIGR01777 family protein [Candidatus Omnitrophica bacterium]|nr:TIGR01777 family protein [Candidatus Omnitrophota bacterium]
MKVLITGSSGFIGSEVTRSFLAQGDPLLRLTRTKRAVASNAFLSWDPERGLLKPAGLEGLDAVIHLAGDPIAQGRWTPEKKARIRNSRVAGTGLLAKTLAQLKNPPKVLVCASAIGVYGSRGDETLTEDSTPGTGFLAEVGKAWEEAAQAARSRGIRVVHLRFGIVLSPTGGALKMMLPPFRMGLGGKLASGKQWMSWISLPEAVQVIHHAIKTEGLKGPVNAVSPQPVTNLEFTKTLGKVLSRPTAFPVPAFAVRLLFGEMGEELLLASARVLPKRLQESGYRFLHPTLEEAFRKTL